MGVGNGKFAKVDLLLAQIATRLGGIKGAGDTLELIGLSHFSSLEYSCHYSQGIILASIVSILLLVGEWPRFLSETPTLLWSVT
jgi:hypothetical protein